MGEIIMMLDISDTQFKRIFSNPKFYLPIRWDNKDFLYTLKALMWMGVLFVLL